jgi:CSLREA domain-containing protein
MRPALLSAAGLALVLPAVKPIAGVAPTDILLLITATDEHDGGLCDSECTLREAIDAANAHPGSTGIRFSVMARSILVGLLPNVCLIGHSP